MPSYSNEKKNKVSRKGINIIPEGPKKFFLESLGENSRPVPYEDSFTIRLADSSFQRNSARMLVNKMYAWRGYGDDHVIPELPTHTTFTASSGENTVGTITLAVDSVEGLAADRLFKKEIDEYRGKPGTFVCELTKLAFDMRGPSQALLASMFHLVFIYGQRRYRCTDLFIEVNPRHVRFYEHMLGFTPIGEVRMNTSVSAPAQLMWLKVAAIREFINRYAGHSDAVRGRSLYSHFFAPHEEDAIYRRMLDVASGAAKRTRKAPAVASRRSGGEASSKQGEAKVLAPDLV